MPTKDTLTLYPRRSQSHSSKQSTFICKSKLCMFMSCTCALETIFFTILVMRSCQAENRTYYLLGSASLFVMQQYYKSKQPNLKYLADNHQKTSWVDQILSDPGGGDLVHSTSCYYSGPGSTLGCQSSVVCFYEKKL